MTVASRRYERDRARMEAAQFRTDNVASVNRQMRRGIMPRGLAGLLRWYLDAWATEVPIEREGLGVFIGQPDRESTNGHRALWAAHSKPSELTGGSHLGAPNQTDEWRRYMENAEDELDGDGFYVRPIHAALKRMAGPVGYYGSPDEDAKLGKYPFMARWLFRVGLAQGNWQAVGARRGWPEALCETFTETALVRLWERYESARYAN